MNRWVLLLAAQGLLLAGPVVTKVDPPNWWTGHSINPVRVLIRGTGLTGARATASDAGLQVSNVKVNASGTYLFADVRVLSTGKHPIRVTTSEGTTNVPFEVLSPLPRTGRFQGFSQDDLIYLIMPDRFANGDESNDDPAISKGLFDRKKTRYYHGGDLQGIIDHLDYLKNLGVTALWINPVYDNNNGLNRKEVYDDGPITDYHGYGAVDFYGVEEHFGNVAKFRELADKAHTKGIKVILDMVANHSGPYHPWVTDSPTPTWFHGTASNHVKETWQTWTLMDPHAPDAFRRSTLDGWFIDLLPDLNQEDPEVSRYIIQNTLWWVGIAGLDGIRQDTLPYVPRVFWRDWMAAIKREYPSLRVVGELFDGDPALVSFFQGGKPRFDGIDSGVDSLFDFPLYYSVRHVFAQNKPMTELPQMLSHDVLYPNPDALVTFLGLHDVQRFMSEQGATVDGLKLAFTFLMTVRGIPMIYYGDEIAMEGGNDPDNRRDFPGGWKGDPRNAFAKPGEVAEYIGRVARLRANTPDLRRGKLTEVSVSERTYVFQRGNTFVAINNGSNPESVTFAAKPGKWNDALGNLGEVSSTAGEIRITLQGKSASVLVAR